MHIINITGCEQMFYKIHRLLRLEGIMSRFFFWMIIIVFLLSCLYVALFIFIDKNERIEAAKKNLLYGLQNQENLLTNWAEDRAAEIRLFSSFSVAKEPNINTMATRLEFYHEHHQQLDSIVFLNKEGFVVIDTATEDVIRTNSTVSLKDRDYFQAALAGEEYMHDIVTSKASGEKTIIFSSPVLSDHKEFQGVIFGAVHLDVI